jgi:hypothetical protein
MTEAPWLIPYVDHYTGTTRVLTLVLDASSMIQSRHRPVVSIDGRQYVVVWGQVSFEIPAERNVHVSVHVHGDVIALVASTLLGPGPAVGLRYEVRGLSGVASLVPLPAPPGVEPPR